MLQALGVQGRHELNVAQRDVLQFRLGGEEGDEGGRGFGKKRRPGRRIRRRPRAQQQNFDRRERHGRVGVLQTRRYAVGDGRRGRRIRGQRRRGERVQDEHLAPLGALVERAQQFVQGGGVENRRGRRGRAAAGGGGGRLGRGDFGQRGDRVGDDHGV